MFSNDDSSYQYRLSLYEDQMDLKDKSISELALLIKQDWKKVYFGAVPYLDAMRQMKDINDQFGYDDGKGIVRYFLSNATGWRGEVAKAVKEELKRRLK